MAVYCSRPGGYGIKVNHGDGKLTRIRLKQGENDVDAELVKLALSQAPPELAKAIAADLSFGEGAPVEVPKPSNEDAPEEPEEPASDLSVREKLKLVRAAESLDELRKLAEGEERKTVNDAIDKKAASLGAGEG